MAKKRWVGRVSLGQGKYAYTTPSRFSTKRERDRAVAKARANRGHGRMTVEDYARRFCADYEARHKRSSFDTLSAGLKAFREDYGHRRLDSITRLEAKDWARDQKQGQVRPVITLFNGAVDDEVVDRNPFRGLGHKSKSKVGDPPTLQEFQRLLESCSVLGDYAPQMRSILTFAAHTGMRPGELYALEWGDIDLDRMRVRVARRLYQGELDVPKSGKPREIALPPPARDAILPESQGLVFQTKQGDRLSQPVFHGYWKQVTAKAGLDFTFYLATKHFAVHNLYVTHQKHPRAIAAQMGWSLTSTYKMLETYGHAEIGALEEIDAAYENVVPLRRRESA